MQGPDCNEIARVAASDNDVLFNTRSHDTSDCLRADRQLHSK